MLWPGEEPIGQRISLRSEPRPADWLTVVGVVEDVRQQSLTGDVGRAVYQSYQQVPRLPFPHRRSNRRREPGRIAGGAKDERQADARVEPARGSIANGEDYQPHRTCQRTPEPSAICVSRWCACTFSISSAELVTT